MKLRFNDSLARLGDRRQRHPNGWAERFDSDFLRYAWSWNRLRRAPIRGLVEGFPGRRSGLRSGAERSRFLADPV